MKVEEGSRSRTRNQIAAQPCVHYMSGVRECEGEGQRNIMHHKERRADEQCNAKKLITDCIEQTLFNWMANSLPPPSLTQGDDDDAMSRDTSPCPACLLEERAQW